VDRAGLAGRHARCDCVPDREIEIRDRAQGLVRERRPDDGKFVVRQRAPVAYQLAVVVDDANQGILT
jgi:glutamyl/glutaminyl-tRNA synthetase